MTGESWLLAANREEMLAGRQRHFQVRRARHFDFFTHHMVRKCAGWRASQAISQRYSRLEPFAAGAAASMRSPSSGCTPALAPEPSSIPPKLIDPIVLALPRIRWEAHRAAAFAMYGFPLDVRAKLIESVERGI